MEFHTSESVFKESGEYVPSAFDWFGELWELSGWCEGKCPWD